MSELNPLQKAKELVTEHYLILFDVDSDLSEECLISILSMKHALVTVDEILKNSEDPVYWNAVRKHITQM